MAAFNRELHWHDLLKIDPSLGSSTPKVRSYKGLAIRSEAPISVGYDLHVDIYLADLKKVDDPSSHLAVAPTLEFMQLVTPTKVV